MIKIGGLPVKTRVPGTAWIIAGLLTLLSIVSSAVQDIPPSERAIAASAQPSQGKDAHQASVSW